MKEHPISKVHSAVIRKTKKPVWHLVHGLTRHRLTATAHIHEWGQIGADFPVKISKVQSLLPSDRLQLVEHEPGVTKLMFRANDVRKISLLDPYFECSVMLPVNYLGIDSRFTMAYYCLYMPVSTPEACWVGEKLYGFPRLLAEITFHDMGKLMCCHAKADGKDIFLIEVPKMEPNNQRFDWYLYTIWKHKLVRTQMEVKGDYTINSAENTGRLMLGDHPIAQALAELEIDFTPTCQIYAPYLQGRLHKPGRILGM